MGLAANYTELVVVLPMGSSEGPWSSQDPSEPPGHSSFNPLASRGSITSLSFPHSPNQPRTTGPQKASPHQVSLPLGPHVSAENNHTSCALTNPRRAGCSQHKHLSCLCRHSTFESLSCPLDSYAVVRSSPLCLLAWGHISKLSSWPHGGPWRKLELE